MVESSPRQTPSLMRQLTVKSPTPDVRRRLAVWLVALLPFLVLGAVVYYAIAQPGCVSCHGKNSEFREATAQSSHASVACVACHVGPSGLDRLGFGFRQLFHMVIPVTDGTGREWAAVDDMRCLVCHQQVNTRVVSSNGFRINHKTCASEARCTDCHSTVAHGTLGQWTRDYSMDGCLKCHSSLEPGKCDLCHDNKDREARIQTSVFAVTHGKEWRKTHGMGDSATCSVCHTPDKCFKCHGAGLPHGKDFLGQHSQVAVDPTAKCASCHDPSFCSDCHGLKMPHSKAFVLNHASSAKSDPAVCKRCHAGGDCTECHVRHIHPGGAIGKLGPYSAPTTSGP